MATRELKFRVFVKMKKYNVIYADPPWKTKAGRPFAGYKVVDGIQIFNSVDNRSRELSYPTMTVEEIAGMNIKALAAEDAHLYLWVTNQYLLQAERVINAWGFKYVACITWKKKRMGGGLGGTVRITSEHLLFCRRGSLKATGVIPESVIEAKRAYVNGKPCHSKKPDVFYEIIESVSPGERLELFARNHREGWDVFGNQVNNSITIP